MSGRKKFTVLLLLGLLAYTGVVGWGWKNSGKVALVKNGTDKSKQEVTVKRVGVEIRVDFGRGEVVESGDLGRAGMTVYELLDLLAQAKDLQVVSQQYDFGLMVKAIAGRENSQEKAWIYFVNGQAGEVGANQKVLQDGDRVEWKYSDL